MRLRLLISLMCAFLAGCSTQTRTIYITPPLVEYSPEEQTAVADELDACADKCETVEKMIDDYGRLREAIRETSPDT